MQALYVILSSAESNTERTEDAPKLKMLTRGRGEQAAGLVLCSGCTTLTWTGTSVAWVGHARQTHVQPAHQDSGQCPQSGSVGAKKSVQVQLRDQVLLPEGSRVRESRKG